MIFGNLANFGLFTINDISAINISSLYYYFMSNEDPVWDDDAGNEPHDVPPKPLYSHPHRRQHDPTPTQTPTL